MVLYAVARIFEDPKSNNLQQADAAYKADRRRSTRGFAPSKIASITNLERLQKYDEALVLLKPLAEANPQNADIQLVYGRILVRKGDFLAAVNPLEVATKANPNNAEVQAMYGTALLYARQQPEALAAYQKAVQLAPTNVDYKTTYGLLLGMSDKFAEGIKALEKVVATPGYKNAAGYTNLGWVYRNAEPPQAEKAVTAYAQGARARPQERPGGARPRLGPVVRAQVRRGDRGVHEGDRARSKLAGEALNGTAWAQYFKKDMAAAKATATKAKAAGSERRGPADGDRQVREGRRRPPRTRKRRKAAGEGSGDRRGGGVGRLRCVGRRVMKGADRADGGGRGAPSTAGAPSSTSSTPLPTTGTSACAVPPPSRSATSAARPRARVRSCATWRTTTRTRRPSWTPEEQQQFVAVRGPAARSLRAAVAKIGC